jgi:hypothetical protein
MIASIAASGNIGQSVNLVASALPVVGTVGTAGNIGTAVTFDLAGASIAVTGTVGTAGNVAYGITVNIGTASLPIAGAVTASGDLSVTTAILLDVVPTAPAAVAGVATISGELNVVRFDLAVAAGPALTGAVVVDTEFDWGYAFEIQASTIAVLSSIMAAAGIQMRVPTDVPRPRAPHDDHEHHHRPRNISSVKRR